MADEREVAGCPGLIFIGCMVGSGSEQDICSTRGLCVLCTVLCCLLSPFIKNDRMKHCLIIVQTYTLDSSY